MKFLVLLKSRKFWACVVGVAFVVIRAYAPEFPLSEEQALQVVLLLVSFILGVALEDGLAGRKVPAKGSGYDPADPWY